MGRRRYTADFKRRVVVEAMRGDQTVQAIAARHGINPNQLSRWKTEAYNGLLEVFGDGAGGGTAAAGRGGADQHGRQGPVDGQPVRRASVDVVEVRGRLSGGDRRRTPRPAADRILVRSLQPPAPPPGLRRQDAGRGTSAAGPTCCLPRAGEVKRVHRGARSGAAPRRRRASPVSSTTAQTMRETPAAAT